MGTKSRKTYNGCQVLASLAKRKGKWYVVDRDLGNGSNESIVITDSD